MNWFGVVELLAIYCTLNALSLHSHRLHCELDSKVSIQTFLDNVSTVWWFLRCFKQEVPRFLRSDGLLVIEDRAFGVD
jgi:hypothetical protein